MVSFEPPRFKPKASASLVCALRCDLALPRDGRNGQLCLFGFVPARSEKVGRTPHLLFLCGIASFRSTCALTWIVLFFFFLKKALGKFDVSPIAALPPSHARKRGRRQGAEAGDSGIETGGRRKLLPSLPANGLSGSADAVGPETDNAEGHFGPARAPSIAPPRRGRAGCQNCTTRLT